VSDWAKIAFSEFPCNNCNKRWPNERNPDTEIGDGCDGLGCEYRPDLTDEYEPIEGTEESVRETLQKELI